MEQVSYEQLNTIRKKALYSNVIYYGFIGVILFLFSSFFWLSDVWLHLVSEENVGYLFYGAGGIFVVGLFVLGPRTDQTKKEAKRLYFEALSPLLTYPVSFGSSQSILPLVPTSGLFEHHTSRKTDDRYSTTIQEKEAIFSHLILKRTRSFSNNPNSQETVFNGFFAMIPTDLPSTHVTFASYEQRIGFVTIGYVEDIPHLPDAFTSHFYIGTTDEAFGQQVFTHNRINALMHLHKGGYQVKFSVNEGMLFLAFKTKHNLFDPSFSTPWTASGFQEAANELNAFLALLHQLK